MSRWCGVLRIVSEAYDDDEPIYQNPAPFVVRFKASPIVLLEPEYSLPILDDASWDALSETRGIQTGRTPRQKTLIWDGVFSGEAYASISADCYRS